MQTSNQTFFQPQAWRRKGGGSLYLQLSQYISQAIQSGELIKGTQLPAERELAELAQVSRVTIRKAVQELANSGLIEQRRGSGSFVLGVGSKTEQSLSSLVSFTENMQARGRQSTSKIIQRGLYLPAPNEMMALGLSPHQRVARIERLRSADGVPMALELSSLPADTLPEPNEVTDSLYAILRKRGLAPTRAIQRVTAINVGADQARILGIAEKTALLQIERTAYLSSGRPIEFTTGLYRPDIYDFISELRPENDI